jgi:hypothetical protein
MGIGISIFLIAVGAVLAFGVDVAVRGLDLTTVGVILMIAGGIGLFMDLLIFGGGGRMGRRTTVVRRDPDVIDPVLGDRVGGGRVVGGRVDEYHRVDEF